jgi:hypothetical protein
MQRDFIFAFVYQNNENMIHYLRTIKGYLVYLSLSISLSSIRFTMINKKQASLLSVKMGTATLKHGNIVNF